jgi:hypothetical protein
VRPRQLAPLLAVAVRPYALDDRPGDEIVVVHRPPAAARRPGEVWVFGGGPTPTRVALQRVGVGPRALAVLDLDRDGHDDLVVTTSDAPRVDVLFGDGRAGFPRTRSLALRGATEAAVGDLDGDGRPELVLAGESTAIVEAGAAALLEFRAIEAAAGLRDAVVIDVDGDGRRELVGYLHPRIVAFDSDSLFPPRPRPDGSDAPGRASVPLPRTVRGFGPGEPVPSALVVADLDADGRVDAAWLAQPTPDAPAALVIARDVTSLATRRFRLAGRTVPDAPLALRLQLR